MEYFTLRNAAIAGLVQIGIVVAGVLAAGACLKWSATTGLPPPRRTVLVAEYGFLALALPLAWTSAAAVALRRAEHGDFEATGVVFFTGGGLVVVLLTVACHAAFGPLFRMIAGGCGMTLGMGT